MNKEERETNTVFNIGNYIKEESRGGIILILVTILAVVWANSGFYEWYDYLWHELKLGFSFGEFKLSLSLQHWINDGLMAVFFFAIGLEIKREVLAGELSSLKKASLPIMAAIGGMVFPAAFYVIININNPYYIHGWGIPMATDIAFALGMMSLLGKRVPVSLKIFLTALAIADDLGAIMVIAFFYTSSIDYTDLINGGFFLVVLMVANHLGVRRTSFYALVGFTGVWLSILYSGVHATIAGVLIAFTIPVRTKVNESIYIDRLCDLLDEFKQAKPNDVSLLTQKQSHLVSDIEKLSADAQTPLQKLEQALHPITAYIILPLFALANAGIQLERDIFSVIFHPISLGIIIGLVLGKVTGIVLLSKLMIRLKLASLPEGSNWRHIYGVGFLAGIGFTMSIFISDLAFVNERYVEIAKAGIFAASILSTALGMTLLGYQKNRFVG